MFDTVVTVDWSASSRPTIGADSIWICVLDVESRQTQLHNPPTRHQAAARLCSALVDRPGSVLVAVDVALGYPQGFARLLGCTTNAPWRFTWDLVSTMLVDRPDNDNNRFDVAAALNATISPGPGPFWGTTSAASVRPSLQRTKPPGFPHCCPSGESLGEWRRTEQALRARRRHPASVWQLAGAGSVGSQTLTAIPVLSAIRDHPALRRRSVVWPFETDLVSDPRHGLPDSIVIAEAWPSAIDVDLARHPVRDAAQVLCLAEHLVELDRDDRLGGWFGPDLVDADRLAVVAEEGWVLGTEVSPLLA